MSSQQRYKNVIESKTCNYVITAIVFMIATTLILLNFFVVKVPYKFNPDIYIQLYQVIGELISFPFFMIFPVLTMVFTMLSIRFKNQILMYFRWAVVVFSILPMFPCLLGNNGGFAVYYLIIIAFIFNAFGCYLCRIPVFLFYICLLNGQIFNKNYNGTPPISRKGKLLEVLIQLIMLPVSAAISGYSLTIIGTFFIALFVKSYDEGFKGEDDNSYTYYVEPSDRVVTETERQGVYDDAGRKVGEIQVEKSRVVHDDGKRIGGMEWHKSITHSIFFLPLRVVSFLLSIVAVFVPKMYVKIVKPSKVNKGAYDHQLFKYLDLIVFNCEAGSTRGGNPPDAVSDQPLQ